MDLVNQLLRGEVRFSALQVQTVTGECVSFSRFSVVHSSFSFIGIFQLFLFRNGVGD